MKTDKQVEQEVRDEIDREIYKAMRKTNKMMRQFPW
jgi:hypothetical protein